MAPRSLIGTVVPVTITQIGTNTLFGTIAGAVAAPVLAAAGA
jgi:hypothetical protein